MTGTQEERSTGGVLVVLPTYNERGNITMMLEAVLAQLPLAHVLVVDDGSPDGTGALVSTFAERDDRVRLLDRGRKLGLGTAYLAGFHYALAGGYESVITMDSDFSHPPAYLPGLLAAGGEPGVDVVVGSRYTRGGAIDGWGWNRRILSWGANRFARTLLRLPISDCTGGFRLYRRRVLGEMDLEGVVSHGYSALVELLWHLWNAGYTVREVPITFTDRAHGASKISRGEILRGVTTVIRLASRPRPGRSS
jgi:dolichol-phosphate mannosyltransferase